MAQKSPAGNGLSFPYKDLEYEVARRRRTMTTREEVLTKEGEEALVRKLKGLDQFPSPDMADRPPPPAPPPSPADDLQVS
ncbi:myocilin opposite strand protein [Pipistrellus kuhlii]|uniref:Myocilin opposite strand n=1 Tax=Pipistrellus kuhlii TaxID=59472 RepID=A0A7J7UTR6_PIPKU|nr:myocilin opposite strand protein [Pipistrellus kuhlii]KAF6316307.1 myocilin opposite strand [Pipistrellus kuhlii]